MNTATQTHSHTPAGTLPAPLDELAARGQAAPLPLPELAALFAALPATDCEAMLGRWTGGLLPTGHPGEAQLGQLRWAGKDFHSLEDVAPIVSLDANGQRVANPVLGAARLRMATLPGDAQPTAAMVYDQHPVIDHFKRIDARTVLGVMDRKGDRQPLYFYLQRLD